MQEIKFRARLLKPHSDLKSGDWIYFYPFIESISSEVDNGVAYVDKLPVDTRTLGQYIELKDKNGSEIYENDLTHAKGSKMIFRVEYHQGSFCLIPHHTHSKASKEFWEAEDGKLNIMPLHLMMKNGGLGDLEVVGNIHSGLLRND